MLRMILISFVLSSLQAVESSNLTHVHQSDFKRFDCSKAGDKPMNCWRFKSDAYDYESYYLSIKCAKHHISNSVQFNCNINTEYLEMFYIDLAKNQLVSNKLIIDGSKYFQTFQSIQLATMRCEAANETSSRFYCGILSLNSADTSSKTHFNSAMDDAIVVSQRVQQCPSAAALSQQPNDSEDFLPLPPICEWKIGQGQPQKLTWITISNLCYFLETKSTTNATDLNPSRRVMISGLKLRSSLKSLMLFGSDYLFKRNEAQIPCNDRLSHFHTLGPYHGAVTVNAFSLTDELSIHGLNVNFTQVPFTDFFESRDRQNCSIVNDQSTKFINNSICKVTELDFHDRCVANRILTQTQSGKLELTMKLTECEPGDMVQVLLQDLQLVALCESELSFSVQNKLAVSFLKLTRATAHIRFSACWLLSYQDETQTCHPDNVNINEKFSKTFPLATSNETSGGRNEVTSCSLTSSRISSGGIQRVQLLHLLPITHYQQSQLQAFCHWVFSHSTFYAQLIVTRYFVNKKQPTTAMQILTNTWHLCNASSAGNLLNLPAGVTLEGQVSVMIIKGFAKDLVSAHDRDMISKFSNIKLDWRNKL